MRLSGFLDILKNSPNTIQFSDTMAVVEDLYEFTPTRFRNGDTINEAGQNSGSCKLFGFAQLQNLSKEETLDCFGEYYRNDVLQNPNGTDHQNIRNFIKSGWEGISFDGSPLELK